MVRFSNVILLVFDATLSLVHLLALEFDFQVLEFDFLRQHIILTIVFHFVELIVVTIHGFLSAADLISTHSNIFCEFLDILIILDDTMRETFDFIFEILHFQWKFTAQGLDLVYFRKHGLEFIQRLQFLFYGHVRCIFLYCHIFYIMLISFIFVWSARCSDNDIF
ncbi:membrane protein [gut metagenome]|uniref:Membrane protein n=1 Tax=gut metagenome TaxID=749906 RepID=J9G527_9ZZZZ